MFTSLRRPSSSTVMVTINGQSVPAHAGQTVWAAMALAGQTVTRQAALSGEDRSAFCAMGVCFECMVEIDGQPNQQACLRRVTEGMTIQTQNITEHSGAQNHGL